MSNPNPPAGVATPGDPAAAYRNKVATRSTDQGVREGEIVLESRQTTPWWKAPEAQRRWREMKEAGR